MKKIILKRKPKKVKPPADTPEACLTRRYGPNKTFNELLACAANEILAMQNGMYEVAGCESSVIDNEIIKAEPQLIMTLCDNDKHIFANERLLELANYRKRRIDIIIHKGFKNERLENAYVKISASVKKFENKIKELKITKDLDRQ